MEGYPTGKVSKRATSEEEDEVLPSTLDDAGNKLAHDKGTTREKEICQGQMIQNTEVKLETTKNEPLVEPQSNSCPICFNPTEVFVSGRCRHSLCVDCMELVLNANAASERWPPLSATDIHLSAPTLGRCPICRSELSLFEVVYHKSLEPLYTVDYDSWKPRQQEQQKQNPEGQ